MTNFTRNIFTKRESGFDAFIRIASPYAGGIFMAWCIVWLILMSFDGVRK